MSKANRFLRRLRNKIKNERLRNKNFSLILSDCIFV